MVAKYSIVVAIIIGVTGVGAWPQETQRVPRPTAATPSACLKEAFDFESTRSREARALPQGATPEEAMARQKKVAALLQEIDNTAAEMRKACAARFDVASVAERELASLADLYHQVGKPDLAKAAIDRAVGVKGLPEADRAAVIVQAVRLGVREKPRTDARDAELETLVDELDKMSHSVIAQKFRAHKIFAGYARDTAIVKHSSWIINTAKDPALRKMLPPDAIEDVPNAYRELARGWTNQGQHERALALLRGATAELSEMRAGDPVFADFLRADIDRLQLIGTVAAPIMAPRWLNMPAGTTSLDLAGKVTLVEFSAHWCIPCVDSYPGLNRLRAKYGARGFQVVLATRLYGYFQKEKDLAADVEFERLRPYFAGYGLDVPVAVGNHVREVRVGGKIQYVPAQDPNDRAYHVRGIPQINLIDTQGRIRLVMVGYDDADEPRLDAMIASLLSQR